MNNQEDIKLQGGRKDCMVRFTSKAGLKASLSTSSVSQGFLSLLFFIFYFLAVFVVVVVVVVFF